MIAYAPWVRWWAAGLLGAGATLVASMAETQPGTPRDASAAARAAPPAVPPAISVSARARFEPYSAPPACPDGNSFLVQVATLLGKNPNTVATPLGEFDVVIRQEGAVFVGVVRSVTSEGGGWPRELRGSDCGVLVHALAMLVAQAINPQAGAVMSPATPGPPAWGLGAASPTTARPIPPTARPADSPPAESPSRPGHWIPTVGVDARLDTGIAPSTSFGAALRLGVERGFGGWAPAGFLEGAYFLRHAVTTPLGGASFEWAGVSLGGCPAAWGGDPGWSFRPCLLFELGSLQATGSGTASPARVTRPWVALGVIGRAGYRFPSGIELGAGFGLVSPLERDRFIVGSPRVTVHVVPALALRAAVGLGYAFR
jgi:hypothetical protein